MSKSGLKYSQSIYAKITRIYDEEKKEYLLMRNETKIIFGEGKNLLGTVIMTNPGSFDFKYDLNWTSFISGDGDQDTFESSSGKPDPTMINIIKSIEKVYELRGASIPDGYVRIYNLSSVKCSKGDMALDKHNRVKEILGKNEGYISLLQDPAVYDEECFKNVCDESPFVILGFLKDILCDEVKRLNNWIEKYGRGKKVTAPDKNGHPYHPILWIKMSGGSSFRKIVNDLSKVI